MKRRLLLLVAIAALSTGVVLKPGTASAQVGVPSFTVFMGPKFLTTEGVAGFFWPPGSTVTMQIDNGNNGSVEYTATSTAQADGGVSFPSNAGTSFAVTEGDLVRMSDDATPQDVAQMTVQYMTLTTLDPATDTIAGTARPGTELYVYLGAEQHTLVAQTTTGSDGNWSVDLAGSGVSLTDGLYGFVQTEQAGGNHTQINWQVLPTSQRLAAIDSDASYANSTPVSHVIGAYVTRAERLLAQGKASVVCTQTRSLYQPIKAFQRSGAEPVQQAWQLTHDVGWLLVSLSC